MSFMKINSNLKLLRYFTHKYYHFSADVTALNIWAFSQNQSESDHITYNVMISFNVEKIGVVILS